MPWRNAAEERPDGVIDLEGRRQERALDEIERLEPGLALAAMLWFGGEHPVTREPLPARAPSLEELRAIARAVGW